MVRYCDDLVVTANRRWKAKRADRLVRSVLHGMGLRVNEANSGVRNVSRETFEFLGFSFYGGRFLRPGHAIRSFKNHVRWLTRRKRGISLQAVIGQLAPVLRGWGNFFVIGHVAKLFEELDQWVRMRLRSYVTKRRATSLRTNMRLKTAKLAQMGLVSLVALRQATLSPAMGPGRG
jgi:RNA-directed DNA polymerase